MNRTIEKVCDGHYLVKTEECGQFSVSKHEGAWVLRNEGHLIDRLTTKKEAIREISERQRIERQKNWKTMGTTDEQESIQKLRDQNAALFAALELAKTAVPDFGGGKAAERFRAAYAELNATHPAVPV